MSQDHRTKDSMPYRCVVADPPWKVAAGREIGGYALNVDGIQPFVVKSQEARRLSYPTMTIGQLKDLAPELLCDEQAHLYLWTVNAYLRDAFDILQAWGFTYSATLVWAKNPMGGGLGGCYGLATEYCLFGYRGRQDAQTRIGRNWWNWRRAYDERGKPRHSAKPPEFFEMVEGMSPGPRLEMFARAPREGWHVWGNEVESDVEMPTYEREGQEEAAV